MTLMPDVSTQLWPQPPHGLHIAFRPGPVECGSPASAFAMSANPPPEPAGAPLPPSLLQSLATSRSIFKLPVPPAWHLRRSTSGILLTQTDKISCRIAKACDVTHTRAAAPPVWSDFQSLQYLVL